MQAPLLPLFETRAEPRPRKRVRAVSKQVYAELRDTGQLSKRTADVLRELAAYYNRRAEWPTVNELATWMHAHGDLPRPDSRLIAPRICELSKGTQDRKTGTFHGGGVIEALPARPCQIAQSKAHPWCIREIGSTAR